ncbi:MAG: serine/threonine-protein kinase [Myxococcota bacterium]
MARALAAAHERGIVHRDVEPNNVVLHRHRGRELAKVLDFGLARLASNDEGLTDVGVRLGTVEYMSPEYVQTGDLEPRSDVYALGVLLYTMLSGHPPFSGRTLTVMQEHVATTPPPLASQVPGVLPALDELVADMLGKQPEERPSAAEVVDYLTQILPALDAEAGQTRRAHSGFSTLPPPPPAAVAHLSDSEHPVYPDPEPIPKLPLILSLVLFAFAAVGLVGLVAIALLLALL